jgi:hypothetical protein
VNDCDHKTVSGLWFVIVDYLVLGLGLWSLIVRERQGQSPRPKTIITVVFALLRSGAAVVPS